MKSIFAVLCGCLVLALGLGIGDPVLAFEAKNHQYQERDGHRDSHRSHYKKYEKPPVNVERFVERVMIPCLKARQDSGSGVNCYEVFNRPPGEAQFELRALVAPSNNVVNVDGAGDATNLRVIDGRVWLTQ